MATGCCPPSGRDLASTIGPADVVRRASRAYADNVAVVVGDRALTYAQVFDRACRLANVLRDAGLQRGDRVAILGANGIESLEQVEACALGAFARATLYTYHSPEVNQYLLGLVGAKALLLDAASFAALEPRLAALPELRCVLVTGPEPPPGADSYEQALSRADSTDPAVDSAPDDIHIIRFSSGTTGRPKGICHTNSRWMEFNNEYRWVTPMLDEASSYLVPGSLAHFGVALLWGVIAVGGRIVLMPSFDAGVALELIETQRVTHVAAVPIMIKAMVEEPAATTRDLSSLRCMMYAGSPIAERTLRQALRVFGPVMFQVFAQSEVLLISVLGPAQHRPDGSRVEQRRLKSTGRATPHVVLTIRDENGACLPAGAVGEIAVISPGSMSFLWNDPEGTAERTLPDGSILTRDMGYLDDDGFLYLVDRKDDMIVSGGYNIWPSELEAALASHPGVAEACVVGVPDDKWGETPKAIVVAAAGSTPTAQELIEHSRGVVGPVKKVTSVEFVDELPKSAAGKVLRQRLRDPFWADEVGRIRGS
jgi:acyl-CoA synthetase (AMP-forming)/AMP-acid ligase II